MFEQFYALVGWNALIAAGLGLAVAALCYTKFARRRPALRHALWLLVLLKLVTPAFVPLPVLPAPELAKRAIAPIDEGTKEVASGAAKVGLRKSLESTDISYPVVTGVESADRTSAAVPLPHRSILNAAWFWTIAPLTLWFIGTAFVVTRCWLHSRRLRKLIAMGEPLCSRVQRIVDRACEAMQVSLVEATVVDAKISPCIWSTRREVCIVLPSSIANELSDEQLRSIVCHELAHVVRGDTFVNSFALFVSAICWWHPAAWLAWRELRKAQEVCCDELAIERSGVARVSYLKTLLAAIDMVGSEKQVSTFPAVGFGESKSLLRRFETLASGTLVPNTSWKARTMLLALLTFLLVIPVAAKPPAAKKGQEPASDPAKKASPQKKVAKKLYLHWIAPGLPRKPKARLLKTLPIKVGEKFRVKFKDPKFKSRKCEIHGRFTIKQGKYLGLVQGVWKSGTQFKGVFQVDQLHKGKPLGFASAYYGTQIVLTDKKSPVVFLNRAAYRNKAAAAVAAPGKKVVVPKIKAMRLKWPLINSVAVSPNCRWVITGMKDGGVVLWDAKERGRKQLFLPSGKGLPVATVDFHPNSRWMASSQPDNTVAIWSNQGRKLHSLKLKSRATAIVFAADGKSLFVGTRKGVVHQWNFASETRGKFRKQLVGRVTALTVGSDRKLVTAAAGNNVIIWQADGKRVSELQHPKIVTAIALSKDGKTVATGCFNGHVRQWGVNGGGLQWGPKRYPGGQVRKMVYTYNNRIIHVSCDTMNHYINGPRGQTLARTVSKVPFITVVMTGFATKPSSKEKRKYRWNFFAPLRATLPTPKLAITETSEPAS